jgi:hypothetical protein
VDVLLLVGLLGLAPVSGCEAPTQQVATVSFKTVLADDDIRSLLGSDTLVSEVHAWHGGITASYRPPRAQPLPVILDEARAQLSVGFRRALVANTARLRHFAAAYGRDKLERDPDVREELTALLDLRKAIAAGLEASTSGAPLVHGVKAEGDLRVLEGRAQVHEGPVLEPLVHGEVDLHRRAQAPDLASLIRALAEFTAELEYEPRSRPSKWTTLEAPNPVVPAWWPQKGDLFYDGDRFVDSTMKWFAVDVQASEPEAGYEHSIVVGRGFLQGCTTMTTVPNGYAQCAQSVWEHEPDFDSHRIGTRNLRSVTVGTSYWGMWSFTGSDPEIELTENRLTGRQTRPSTGCASPPCFATTKRVWFINRGNGEFRRGQSAITRWSADRVWELKDGIPNEE